MKSRRLQATARLDGIFVHQPSLQENLAGPVRPDLPRGTGRAAEFLEQASRKDITQCSKGLKGRERYSQYCHLAHTLGITLLIATVAGIMRSKSRTGRSNPILSRQAASGRRPARIIAEDACSSPADCEAFRSEGRQIAVRGMLPADVACRTKRRTVSNLPHCRQQAHPAAAGTVRGRVWRPPYSCRTASCGRGPRYLASRQHRDTRTPTLA